MALTVMEKWGLETLHDMPDDQIDLLDTIGNEHPHLKNGITDKLYTDDSLRPLRDDIMEALGNDEFLDSFAEQAKEDPSIIDRMNHLIQNDPDKLQKMLPEIKKNPDELSNILNENVTQEQAQVAKVAATTMANETANNPMGALDNMDFGKMFEGLGDFDMSGMMASLGEMLTSMIDGIHGMIEQLMGGISKFTQSNELVVGGNGVAAGNPNSPMAQVAKELNINPDIHTETENGVVQTASMSQQLDNNSQTPSTPGAPNLAAASAKQNAGQTPTPELEVKPTGTS